jgi:hypothetical protein
MERTGERFELGDFVNPRAHSSHSSELRELLGARWLGAGVATVGRGWG